MIITSKSLSRSNIAFVISKDSFVSPDNPNFSALYSGDAGRGAQFIDDPYMRVKFLSVPSLQMVFVLEGERFRVDDESGQEPKKSALVSEALKALPILFPKSKVESFGFNFDVYFRSQNVLPMDHWFSSFYGQEMQGAKVLRNFGLQFMLSDKDGSTETYFFKITAPLEMVVHANFHFDKKLPDIKKLTSLMEEKYSSIDKLVSGLNF